jgi:hypothetical protein
MLFRRAGNVWPADEKEIASLASKGAISLFFDPAPRL